jgi:hypothetical protein
MAELVFFGTAATNDYTIWKSDGSSSGTTQLITTSVLSDLYGSAVTVPGPILLYANNTIYAQAQDSLLVWDSSGHSVITSATTNTPHGQGSVAFGTPQTFAVYDGLVYFNGSYLVGLAGTENDLFSTDGTQHGTTQVSYSNLNPGSLAVAFGKLFFSGFDSSSGNNVLWSWDGSTLEQVPGVDVVNPQYLTLSVAGHEFAIDFPSPPHLAPGPSLFMSGQDSSGGPTWLYRYDGTTVTKIAPTTADQSNGLQPYNLAGLVWIGETRIGNEEVAVPYQSAVFFSGVDANLNTRLWMSAGTSETTVPITVPHGLDNLYPFNLNGFNGQLYFTGYDDPNNSQGRGLFVYDPVTNTASRLIDSHPDSSQTNRAALDPQFNSDWEGEQGALGSAMFNQTTMTVFNNDLYFSATEPSGGVANLWRANLNSQGNSANPTVVYSVSQIGLAPFSLTIAEL